MTPFPWADHKPSTDFPENFKFKVPGNKIAGRIVRIETTTFNGRSDPMPELILETANGERSVVATQTMLRSDLADQAPQVGGEITITYTRDGESSRAGFSPPKLFDLKVKRGQGLPAGVDPLDI
jgi:hypothetical protein